MPLSVEVSVPDILTGRAESGDVTVALVVSMTTSSRSRSASATVLDTSTRSSAIVR